MSTEFLAPTGIHDPAGVFHPTPPQRPGPIQLEPASSYRLVTSLDSARARAALAVRRLAGATDLIELEIDESASSPRLLDAAGDLVSDDWRFLARAIADSTSTGAALYPARLRAEIDTLDLFIHTDLVEGLERAIFTGKPDAGLVAVRLFYSRLGELDQRLGHRRHLLGEQLTEADLSLFAVLIGFDLEYRSHLGGGAASLVDYPNLWAYARGLLRQPGVSDPEELAAIGLVPDATGAYAQPWGRPSPVQGVADLRAAWQQEDDRIWGAA